MKLLDSFVSLIIERGYANVKVQDIIHRAKVGRSTFYAHFENKEQVLKGDNMLRLLLTDKKFTGTTVKCELIFCVCTTTSRRIENWQRKFSEVKPAP